MIPHTLSHRNEPTVIFKSLQDFQVYLQAYPDGFVVVCNAQNQRSLYKISSLDENGMSLRGVDGSQWNPSFDSHDGTVKVATGVSITFPTSQEVQEAQNKFAAKEIKPVSNAPDGRVNGKRNRIRSVVAGLLGGNR